MTTQDSALQVGSVIKDRYLIESEIGRGGHSVVYKALDQKLGATVAIKLLVPPPVAAHSAKERLWREVTALQKLNHPNIVRTYDLYEDAHWSFIIMDYIHGETLYQYVCRNGALPQDFAREVGRQIAEALSLTHRHGILHRDVKPHNIMINKGRQAILTDFGSAKIDGQSTLTATGAFVGTMEFMAPEIFMGARPDARSDVYSLGMSLYFASTGKLPNGSSKFMPPPPQETGFLPSQEGISIATEYDHLIARATSNEPDARFPTMDGMTRALKGEFNPTTFLLVPGLKICLRCGGPDLLELSLCPACRNQGNQGNLLIMVEKDLETHTREHIQQALAKITGLSPDSPRIRNTTKGVTSLFRVTQDAASELIPKLSDKKIPTYSIPRRKAFSLAPQTLKFFTYTNLSFGLWIGLFHLPDFLWISPLVIGLLYLETWKTVCTPLISQGSRTLGFPTDLENRIFLTLSTLAPSPGQNLFADIVRIGSVLFLNSKNNFSDSIFSGQIISSLNLSCKIASELNQIDQHLAVISKHISVSPTDKKRLKLMGNYENHRDKLMQMLLELLSALAIINVQKYTIGDSALQELENIIKELEEESKIQREAEEEVKKYLEEAVPC